LRPATGILDQRCAFGDPCHQQTRSHDVFGRWTLADSLGDFRVLNNRYSKRFGDTYRGNVVVGRANATGSEHVVVGCSHLVNGRNDDRFVVWDHPCVVNLNAPVTQGGGDMVQVYVLSAA
jgi:hypothetical protein